MESKSPKIKISTLIFSDIHLGDKTTRSKEILEVLAKYKCKRIILNGDILDGLNFEHLHPEHWKILTALRKLSEASEVVWIHGNHDGASQLLSRILGLKVYDEYLWTEKGKRFLALHGHQFDWFLINDLILSRIAFSFYYFLKIVNPKGNILSLFKKRNHYWQRNSRQVARGALKYAKSKDADFVFCGHTHMTDHKEKNGIVYFNTGSWVEKPTAYAMILEGQATLKIID
jgi:predicted phosphodiesterase